MDQTPLNLPSKQGRPKSHAASQKPSDVDQDVYNLIKSKEGMGKLELKLQDVIVKKSLTILEIQKLIKVVVDVYYRNHYMAVEFEASKEIIGSSWYVEGKLDVEFIKLVKDLCLKHIDKLDVVTVDGLFDYFRRSGILKVELSIHQIFKILQALGLDNEIEEVKSTGKGENLWGSSVTVA